MIHEYVWLLSLIKMLTKICYCYIQNILWRPIKFRVCRKLDWVCSHEMSGMWVSLLMSAQAWGWKF